MKRMFVYVATVVMALAGSGAVQAAQAVTGRIISVEQEHNVFQDGRKGMALHVKLLINNAQGMRCVVGGVLENEQGNLIRPVSGNYPQDSNGNLIVGTGFTPEFDNTFWTGTIFVPYGEINVPRGAHKLTFRLLIVANEGGAISAVSPMYSDSFTLTNL
jgi:hypothetical protein